MTRSFLAEETGETLADWPEAGLGADGGLDCAKASCLYTARGRTVAIITGEAALPLKCGGLDAIVSQVPAGFRCRSVMPVVDRIDSWRCGGAVARRRGHYRRKHERRTAEIAPGYRIPGRSARHVGRRREPGTLENQFSAASASAHGVDHDGRKWSEETGAAMAAPN